MIRIKDRWLDIAIRVTVVAIVAALGYLGWAYWSNSSEQKVGSPGGRAVENLRNVVRVSPGNANARIRLAEAMAAIGDLDGAIEQYRAALKLEPDYVPAMSGLATILMERKDYKSAETLWQKIIGQLDNTPTASQNPVLDSAYYGLGVTFMETKRYEQAVAAFKEALRIKADASDTHYQLSLAYAKLGYPDKQQDELTVVLTYDPRNAQANYDLGMLMLKKGDVATAAELFRTSADNAPKNVTLPQEQLDKLADEAPAAERLSTARSLAADKPADALVQARIAAALDPTSVEAVRLVAQLSEKLGEKGRALNAWERLLELSPNDAGATTAIKRLNPDGQ